MIHVRVNGTSRLARAVEQALELQPDLVLADARADVVVEVPTAEIEAVRLTGPIAAVSLVPAAVAVGRALEAFGPAADPVVTLFLPAGADGAAAGGPVDALVPLPVSEPISAQAVLVPHTRCWFATCSGIADSSSSVLARLRSRPRLFVPPPGLGFADSARVTEFLRDAGSPSATAFETVVLTDTVTQLAGRVSLCIAFAAVAVVPEVVDAVRAAAGLEAASATTDETLRIGALTQLLEEVLS
jgi:hypothetical protein